ncbi:MAG: glycosyltransferase family 4 protein [Lachnospiraceae bacterium]|nr:glycosyltransferase family 4 protein [Lachnospiraceae bacterium]
MNVLFLTVGHIDDIEERTIYCDLLRCFLKHGHSVYALSPGKKEIQRLSCFGGKDNCVIAHVDIDMMRGGKNIIKKGLSTLQVSKKYIKSIKNGFSNVVFDLVLYSTPPITFNKAVEFVKKRDNVRTYLLLKDIFPQNAVDLGMMKTSGLKGFIYRYFRKTEKKLYLLSDTIGCMSQANMDYVIGNNPEIDPSNVEICPNSIEVVEKRVSKADRQAIREKYGIPSDKVAFIYGGNLGKPQDIPFVIKCLKACEGEDRACFVVVGDGTEYRTLDDYQTNSGQKNFKLIRKIPKEEYDMLVGACDVGLIFLDHRFTIPNFPSRLLSYMQVGIPVLACTDTSSDIGKVIVDAGFGWWCESNDENAFAMTVNDAINQYSDPDMYKRETDYLNTYYSVETAYRIITGTSSE